MIQENTPVLESRRLLLRKFTEGDVEDMLPLYGDEEVNRFLPWFPMKTKAEAVAYLHHTIFPCYEKECAYSYAVVLKAAGRVVGYVHVHDIGGSNDLGYGLCREFWHQGITTEACAAVVERLRRVHFPFLTATHDIHNPYSGEVMKKLGMTSPLFLQRAMDAKKYTGCISDVPAQPGRNRPHLYRIPGNPSVFCRAPALKTAKAPELRDILSGGSGGLFSFSFWRRR